MRTRRIAIACRRTGSANPVVTTPSASAGAPEPWPIDFLPIDLTAVAESALPDFLGADSALPDFMGPEPAVPESLPSRIPHATGAHTRPGNWMDGPGGRANTSHIPTPATPPPGEQDLTLADLTGGTRRDLGWNENPGWPADLDWTRIARVARSPRSATKLQLTNPPRGHSPRHARRGVRTVPHRAYLWTCAGVAAAVLLTVLVALLG